jgi:glutathione S-transferase
MARRVDEILHQSLDEPHRARSSDDMLKLFYFPGACSLAAHIICEELGEPFEPTKLDLLTGDQNKPEFRAVNPHGKVPALVAEGGVLTETPAILTYLADRRPELGLLPTDPFERGSVVSMLTWLSGTLHPCFRRIFRPGMLTSVEEAWDDMRDKARAQAFECLSELDHRLEGRPWLFGDFTVADAHVLVMSRWGFRYGLDMDALPHLVAHGQLVARRPSAERALAREGIRIDG